MFVITTRWSEMLRLFVVEIFDVIALPTEILLVVMDAELVEVVASVHAILISGRGQGKAATPCAIHFVEEQLARARQVLPPRAEPTMNDSLLFPQVNAAFDDEIRRNDKDDHADDDVHDAGGGQRRWNGRRDSGNGCGGRHNNDVVHRANALFVQRLHGHSRMNGYI